MSNKQLFALFLCALVPWVLGNGLLPLLPVYAGLLGATPALVGYYLAISYLALALGTLLAGWLSDVFQRRKEILILSGALNIPAIWLMGQVSQAWQLTALTALVWFLGGIGLTLVAILAGLGAAEHERGRVFGVLGFTGALGALIGGLTTGEIVDRWGFPALFMTLAVFAALLPAFGLLVDDRPSLSSAAASDAAPAVKLGGAFYWVLVASLMSSVILFVGRLGTSLAMNQLHFLSGAVASTAAVGGLVTLPLAPALGWLSDRFNRKVLLALCYIVGAGGMLVLTSAMTLGAFWLATCLLAISGTVGGGLGSALITDVVPREALGRGLAALSAMGWIGGIIGFGLSGVAIQDLGMPPVFIASAGLALLAILPLTLARPRAAAGLGEAVPAAEL